MKKYLAIIAVLTALPSLAKYNPIVPAEKVEVVPAEKVEEALRKFWRHPTRVIIERTRNEARKKLIKFIDKKILVFRYLLRPENIDNVKKRILLELERNAKAYLPLTPMEVNKLASWRLNDVTASKTFFIYRKKRKTAPIHSPVKTEPVTTQPERFIAPPPKQ